jgi:hypothetical protein
MADVGELRMMRARPVIPVSGMFVTMIEYRHPVTFSWAVRFFICRRDGLVRRTIHRSPSGHPAARVSGR